MLRWFIKAKGKIAPQGVPVQWSDGSWHKKVGKKWVNVKGPAGEEHTGKVQKDVAKAEQKLKLAFTASQAGLDLKDIVKERFKIETFADLENKVKSESRDALSDMFKRTFDTLMKQSTAPSGQKLYAMQLFGGAINIMSGYFGQPKKRMTIDVKSKTGKVYRKAKAAPVQSFKPTQLKAAKTKTAGWENMSVLPSVEQVRGMINKGSAKLISGKLDSKKKIAFMRNLKLEDVAVPFKKGAKGIKVKMYQLIQKAKRKKATATVEVTIPYPYARTFLEHQVTSTATRNNLLGQLVRSEPYREVLKVARS